MPGRPGYELTDWFLGEQYDIWPQWLYRLCAGRGAQPRAAVRALRVPAGTSVALNPRTGRLAVAARREAALACFSPSNAEACLWLPRFAACAARKTPVDLRAGDPRRWRIVAPGAQTGAQPQHVGGISAMGGVGFRPAVRVGRHGSGCPWRCAGGRSAGAQHEFPRLALRTLSEHRPGRGMAASGSAGCRCVLVPGGRRGIQPGA